MDVVNTKWSSDCETGYFKFYPVFVNNETLKSHYIKQLKIREAYSADDGWLFEWS